jgi:hypothetical protein
MSSCLPYAASNPRIAFFLFLVVFFISGSLSDFVFGSVDYATGEPLFPISTKNSITSGLGRLVLANQVNLMGFKVIKNFT